MAEHDAAMSPLNLLVGEEASARHGLHTQYLEEIGRDEESLHVFRFVSADEIRRPPFEGGEPLEHVRLLLEVEVVGRREGFAPILIVGPCVGHERDAVDVAHREGPEHERIDHREHCGVRAQAQAERDDDDRAHRRALQDAAAGMPHFESERSHERVSSRPRW